MVNEQRLAAVCGDDPGRARDMARAAGPLETIDVSVDEGADSIDDVPLAGKDAAVAGEQFEKRPAVHRRCRVTSVRCQKHYWPIVNP